MSGPWSPYATYAEYHAARTAVADVIGWGEVSAALETARRIGEARYTVTSLYRPSRDVIVRCDAGRPSVSDASPVCRACLLWEWDGTGELPSNPDAGSCAHCGGDHAQLYGGCCRDCFRLGYREACSRANCRR